MPLKIHRLLVECPLKISWPSFFLRNACDRIGGRSKKMRAALGIRHSPLQDSRGCGGSAVGTKMLEIVNISGTGSCIDAKRNLSFFFKEREKDFLVFNEPSSILRRIFDYLWRYFARPFSHFISLLYNNYNNYVVILFRVNNKKCWNFQNFAMRIETMELLKIIVHVLIFYLYVEVLKIGRLNIIGRSVNVSSISII